MSAASRHSEIVELTIGIQSLDGREDVTKVGVTEVGVDLDVVLDTRGGQSERVNSPFEVVIPVGLSERETLSDSGLIDLNGLDTIVGEINNFVSESQSELLGLDLLGDIGTRERPVENLNISTNLECIEVLLTVTGPVNIPFIGLEVCFWA